MKTPSSQSGSGYFFYILSAASSEFTLFSSLYNSAEPSQRKKSTLSIEPDTHCCSFVSPAIHSSARSAESEHQHQLFLLDTVASCLFFFFFKETCNPTSAFGPETSLDPQAHVSVRPSACGWKHYKSLDLIVNDNRNKVSNYLLS